MIEMLNTQQAMAELQRIESEELELLGLDGFRVRPDGYEGALDLIIDFTASSAAITSPIQRLAEARRFVSVNGGPQVRWEIVSGSLEE